MFSRGGNPKYFFSREIKNTGKLQAVYLDTCLDNLHYINLVTPKIK